MPDCRFGHHWNPLVGSFPGPRRVRLATTGVLLFTLFALVSFEDVLRAGSDPDRGRLSGDNESHRQRSNRGDDKTQPEEDLGIRVETPDGVFVVYDAGTAPDNQPGDAAYLAYWDDFETEELYVYSRLLHDRVGIGQALLNLARDLRVDGAMIARRHYILDDAMKDRAARVPDATQWYPATRDLIRELLRCAELGGGRDDRGTIACQILICMSTGPVTPDPDSDKPTAGRRGHPQARVPDLTPWPCDLVDASIRIACACGGGGDPCAGDPDPCCGDTDPCCGSPDPCCNPNDPCCGNPDRCCNSDNPCCGSPDPCCNVNDPCCGNPDRCCNSDNPCCESSDPCCNSNDPCCGTSDPCCNTDNPCCPSSGCGCDRCCEGSDCCGSTDPCCDPTDPCCGNPDPCCNSDNPDCSICEVACCDSDDPCCNDPCCGDAACCKDRCCQGSPCCGSDDPCCYPTDPCCGNPDPCCNPDNPDCGGGGPGGGGCQEACCNSPDPCCNDPCDDDNPCTDDTCDSQTGACSNECTGAVAASAQTCPVTGTLKEISFRGLSRVTVYAEAGPCEAGNPTRCWGANGIPAAPQWKHEMNPDLAVAYLRGTSMKMDVKIATTGIPEGTGTLRVTGPDGLIGEAPLTVNGCTPVNRVVTITTNPLPNVVKAYTRMRLAWWIRGPGGTTFKRIRTTAHFVYVLLGRPTGSIFLTKHRPTNRRLNFVCNAAWQAGTALEAIDGVALGGPGIHARLNAEPPCDGNELDGVPPCTGSGGIIVDDWRLKAGPPYVGECDQQARLMVTVVKLIGGPGGIAYNTYPSPANDCDPSARVLMTAAQAGITWDIDGDGEIGEERLLLRFDFPDDTPAGDGTNINAFEGTVEYSSLGKYYAVWPSLQATSKCGMLTAIKTMGAIQCWDPVATPEWECVRVPATGEILRVDYPVCTPGCP